MSNFVDAPAVPICQISNDFICMWNFETMVGLIPNSSPPPPQSFFFFDGTKLAILVKKQNRVV